MDILGCRLFFLGQGSRMQGAAPSLNYEERTTRAWRMTMSSSVYTLTSHLWWNPVPNVRAHLACSPSLHQVGSLRSTLATNKSAFHPLSLTRSEPPLSPPQHPISKAKFLKLVSLKSWKAYKNTNCPHEEVVIVWGWWRGCV